MPAAAVPRRKPRQERSKITVNAILEAAAHVFEARGFARASTNVIAQRAGVSIGSLYQYYPDKLALLRAVQARLHDEMMRAMTVACRSHAASLEGALAAVIAAAAEHHRAQAGLERMFAHHLVRESAAAGGASREFQATMRVLLHRHRAELRIADPEMALFLLRSLGRSVLAAAVEERGGDLASGAIARELLRGALACLK